MKKIEKFTPNLLHGWLFTLLGGCGHCLYIRPACLPAMPAALVKLKSKCRGVWYFATLLILKEWCKSPILATFAIDVLVLHMQCFTRVKHGRSELLLYCVRTYVRADDGCMQADRSSFFQNFQQSVEQRSQYCLPIESWPDSPSIVLCMLTIDVPVDDSVKLESPLARSIACGRVGILEG
jgi:hypothetical protein